jgi:hypothetical protein
MRFVIGSGKVQEIAKDSAWQKAFCCALKKLIGGAKGFTWLADGRGDA